MVCKEDVLLWFKDLESYKRIDVLNELLNMCLPFEIRFLGSCLEEVGKHTYQDLRGPGIIANDIDKLSKDITLTHGLQDDVVRQRIVIYVSLLSARNCNGASWYYKNVLRTDWLQSYIDKGNCKDDDMQSELLLLFTMALCHPAFSFDQKTYFGRVVMQLIEMKECKRQLAPKPFPGYPPGFGYPPNQKLNVSTEIPTIPVKTASPMCQVDTPPHQQQHPHLPGFISHPITPVDYVNIWNRPGFIGPISGAPEQVAPFPPQPISPLVSHTTSPTPSGATSPHRNFPIRPGVLQTPPQRLDVMSPSSSIPLDPLSQIGLTNVNPDLRSDDELQHIQDENLLEHPWLTPIVVPMDMKPPNGLRFPPYVKPPQQFVFDQMQALNLEGENLLHCSSSSSSSVSSLNQTPPDTPTATPVIPPHGPGRGDTKPRTNGVPFMNAGPVPPPLCTTTPPPPVPAAFTNCSVPYSSYLPHVSLTAIPNRSILHYSQPYRAPFTSPYPYQPADNVIYSYACPYVPVMFSSPPPPPLPPRHPNNCYNCGESGHNGSECSRQTIEDITQKKGYALEYNLLLPDTDK